MKWSYLGIFYEGEPVEIEGLNIWELKWQRMEMEGPRQPHPSYPTQFHDLTPYTLDIHGKLAYIAAGEVSANVYLFYIGDDHA